MKLDWKMTLIILTSLLCVVAVVCVGIWQGHDGILILTSISGFFGLAMLLSGKKLEKNRIAKVLKALTDNSTKVED